MVRTVLVVDDDMARVADLAAIIRDEGYVAHTAFTFRDGVRLLEAVRPDVLVARLQLGAYNGLHLLLRGRAEQPNLRAIIHGPADPNVEREAGVLGAAAYLPAPISVAAVADAIRKLTPATEDADDGGELPTPGTFAGLMG